MKTTTTVTRLLTVGVLALGVSLSAFAAGPASCGRAPNDRAPMEMHQRGGFADLRGIDLSAAQVAELRKLRDEQQKTMRDKGQALRDQHRALHDLVMSDAYTPAAAAEIIAKIGAAQSEMATLHADGANKLYKLLTPEQRTKLQQNELVGGRAGHGGRGGPRMPS